MRTEPLSEAAERRRLEQELRHTLSQDGFILHYQPQIVLASGVISGAEALIRWPHRRRGMVAPGLFLPLADRGPLGARIGGWVLRTACIEAAVWPVTADIAVNLSPRHLADGALLPQVAEALANSDLAPERLQLEIPEPALLEPSLDVLFTLAALRDLGVGVVLDNFGAGCASLDVFRRMPLSAVKLDRSLIRSVPTDPADVAILRMLVVSAHALGLKLVAGGIETAAQRDLLAELGCDEGQGYLFSQALTAQDLRLRLQS